MDSISSIHVTNRQFNWVTYRHGIIFPPQKITLTTDDIIMEILYDFKLSKEDIIHLYEKYKEQGPRVWRKDLLYGAHIITHIKERYYD